MRLIERPAFARVAIASTPPEASHVTLFDDPPVRWCGQRPDAMYRVARNVLGPCARPASRTVDPAAANSRGVHHHRHLSAIEKPHCRPTVRPAATRAGRRPNPPRLLLTTRVID